MHLAAREGHKQVVKIFLNTISGNKNPKTKPGFKQLGSVTPLDLAVQHGHKEIAGMINATVQEEICHFICPAIKGKPEMLGKCYSPDLLEGNTLHIELDQSLNILKKRFLIFLKFGVLL